MLSREEVWQSWRKQLLRAWASDHRATMTALLEDGPESGRVGESLAGIIDRITPENQHIPERSQEPRNEEFEKLTSEICKVFALLDTEWADADEDHIREEFDPWDALRKICTQLRGESRQ